MDAFYITTFLPPEVCRVGSAKNGSASLIFAAASFDFNPIFSSIFVLRSSSSDWTLFTATFNRSRTIKYILCY